MVKKGILLAFIAQLAIVGFALDAKAKQCQWGLHCVCR